MLKTFLLLAVIALGISANAEPKPAAPLAQSENGQYTLRILKAKWATVKEVASWPGTDRALTLWVDVVSKQPFVPTAAEKEKGRDTLISRLIDGELKVVERYQQLSSVGSNRYGRAIPYLPGESPQGQLIWRATGADPRLEFADLEWEFLVPGSSPKKADWPPALLKSENANPTVSKNDLAETRRFSIHLPLKLVEMPDIPVVPIGAPKSTKFEEQTWQIWPAMASKSRSSVTSMRGATNGMTSPEVELWHINLPLVINAKMPANPQWRFDLRDEQGHEWLAGSSADFWQSSTNFWAPNGALLAPGQSLVNLSAHVAPQLKPEDKWTFEGRQSGKTERVANADFKAIALPQATDLVRPLTQSGPWTIREIRRFSPQNPLPEDWAPTGQADGVALKLALAVPDPNVTTRAYFGDVVLSDGNLVKPYDSGPMIIERKSSPEGAAIVFQMVLPPVEDPALTVDFKISGGFAMEVTPKLVIDGLSFPTPKPKASRE